MVTIALEIRDSMTFIPVIATRLASAINEEAYLIGRAGYTNYSGPTSIMVTRLTDCESANDSRDWDAGTRTMQIAHQYIEENFNKLKAGDVIDVQYIIGETPAPKISERMEALI